MSVTARRILGRLSARSSASRVADARNAPTGMLASMTQSDELRRTRDYLEAYADRAWVYACISSEAKAMKQAPLAVCDPDPDGDGFVDVAPHPLTDLMRKPNPLVRGGLFREEMIIDLEACGNWYAEIVYDGAGQQPAELWRMSPEKVRLVVDRDTGLLAGYLYVPRGNPAEAVALESWQVWHRRYANPLDPYRGIGPLAAARDAVIFDYAANQQTNAYWSNGLRVEGILGGPDNASPDEVKLARLMLERRHTGQNAHRALVLRGDWSYTSLGDTPKDVDWIEGRRASREDVCAAFNVPPPVAGDFTRSTYSNYEEAIKDFWQGNIAEKYASLDEDLTEDLLPLFDETPLRVCRHDLSRIPAMQEDRGAKIDRAAKGFNGGVLTMNEARAEVEELEAMVGYTQIAAPFDGVVTARYVDPGALIEADGHGSASPGNHGADKGAKSPVVSVADISTLRVYVYVPEEETSLVKRGTPSVLRLREFPGREFKGEVARFAHALDLSTRTMLAEIDLPNPTGELYPGMYADVSLELERHPDALQIPATAIQSRGGRKFVWAVRDGALARVAIETGLSSERAVEISSGLTPADEIVRNANPSLSDGARVRAVASEAAETPAAAG